MKISCILIEDEPSSQKVLQKFIGNVDFLDLKGICNDGLLALEFLKTTRVDLLFLDINMPNLSGLTFYKLLRTPPLVIFTTAYSEYAIDGFEVNAVDYLLKPFSFERFLKAVQKVKNIQLEEVKEFITVKADRKLYQLKIANILFIESLGDYIKIHTQDKVLIVYKTLSGIMSLLPENQYIRVHKSFVINQKKINFIEGNQISLGSKKIPIGQKFKEALLTKIKT